MTIFVLYLPELGQEGLVVSPRAVEPLAEGVHGAAALGG